MARGDHSLKRSAEASSDSKPDYKKSKTANNKPPAVSKSPTKGGKPSPAGAKGNGKKTHVPRSLSDAVAKHNKDKKVDNKKPDGKKGETVGKGEDGGKPKKAFKKKTDGKKPFKREAKVPMTPAERRASKPNFALVRHRLRPFLSCFFFCSFFKNALILLFWLHLCLCMSFSLAFIPTAFALLCRCIL